MTITTLQSSTPTTSRATRLWSTGLAAGLAAAAATSAVAAAGHAAGVSLDVSGEPIAVPGFAVVTLVFALVGLAIAAGIRRWAAAPRRTWLVTTGVLTVLSFGPDLVADAATSTKLLLMTTHVVAALVVVPALARRLA